MHSHIQRQAAGIMPLGMNRATMLIYIREKSGKTTPVEVAASDSVEDAREKIEQKGISLTGWNLIYFGKKIRRTQVLSDYGIKHKDTLYLREELQGLGAPGFLLTVAQSSGNVVKLVVSASDRVIDIKQELTREGAPGVDRQRLKAGSVELQNEKSLKDYDITGDAVIWMEDADERKSKEARKRKKVLTDKLKKRLVAVVFVIVAIIMLIWAYVNGKIQINF
ncbi:polyubiquitin [Penaeus vannamei]|uniref:Polyubiquitin n=1 Tax=Penaeus vannamei TaxID=6689 RepID=A0A423UAT9_PENVA|nr:polyubiquitin 8-like isoform X1 [Penaeus vannamei]XP_027214617.1 polyubiquitin 8-like isoform X1 [Penaeus vannamei]XP_027214618.1 polyubiquitin 8-like isoform X1 [Penaeus vannamei]XP_027214619.1 polyubiquitin 8-like isoform X1 [Penaeus vannamei]ROT85795.1 polyubiquitin [Penaeus vannamei]